MIDPDPITLPRSITNQTLRANFSHLAEFLEQNSIEMITKDSRLKIAKKCPRRAIKRIPANANRRGDSLLLSCRIVAASLARNER